MKRRWLVLALALMTAGVVWADLNDDDVLNLFNNFLGRLVVKHEVLGGLAMPGTEIRSPPEAEELTEAVVILSFEKPGDQELFVEALRAENIPFGFFPDGRLLLFSVDMIVFVMRDAIGL
jgi:hypothetical protein